MKTKHILTALALPAMFAACTADDIVSQDNGLQQDQRPMLSEDFVLKVENGIESRYAVEGSTSLNFKFEEGDLIGANVIDAYTAREGEEFDKEDPTTWDIVPYIAPALPFEYNGGEWISAGRVGMGNYLFTNPYNPEDEGRGAAKYELPVIVQYDSENPNAHIEDYNKAVAATILYKADLNANISLKNLFTYPKIRINFDKSLEVKKVTKIVLQKTDEDATFIYKGALDNKNIEKMFNPATIETEIKQSKTDAIVDEASYWATKTTSDFIIDTEEEKEWAGRSAELKTTPYFVYEMNETVKSNSIEVRFMLPSIADFMNPDEDEKITMVVCTDAGNYQMELTDVTNYKFKETTLAAVKKNAFARNMSNTLTTLPINEAYTGSLSTDNIVSTAKDWNTLVEKYGHLKKYSAEYKKNNLGAGNGYGDAEELVVTIFDDEFALTSDLKMPEVAEFVIKTDVGVEGDVTLKNIKMDDAELTVEKDATLTTDPTLNAATVNVKAGGELVFAAEYDEDEELVAYDAIVTVNNEGTVTVPAGVIAQFALNNAKNAVLNVGEAESRAAAEAVANISGTNDGLIVNNSVINIAGEFINNAPTTKAKYVYDEEENAWDGVPTIDNFGTFNAKLYTNNKGLFNNSGVLTSSFVGSSYFWNGKAETAAQSRTEYPAYTALLKVAKNAKTYIDGNYGVIELAEVNPADFTIHEAKDAEDYKNGYWGTIKYTMNDKANNTLDLSASPVTYVVTNVGINLTKTYAYTNDEGDTQVCSLTTLEVNGGEVRIAATTKNADNEDVAVALVDELIIKTGEVLVENKINSVTKVTVKADASLGIPVGAELSIKDLTEESLVLTTGDGTLDETNGKLKVNGILNLWDVTGDAEGYYNGEISEDIELHKGVKITTKADLSDSSTVAEAKKNDKKVEALQILVDAYLANSKYIKTYGGTVDTWAKQTTGHVKWCMTEGQKDETWVKKATAEFLAKWNAISTTDTDLTAETMWTTVEAENNLIDAGEYDGHNGTEIVKKKRALSAARAAATTAATMQTGIKTALGNSWIVDGDNVTVYVKEYDGQAETEIADAKGEKMVDKYIEAIEALVKNPTDALSNTQYLAWRDMIEGKLNSTTSAAEKDKYPGLVKTADYIDASSYIEKYEGSALYNDMKLWKYLDKYSEEAGETYVKYNAENLSIDNMTKAFEAIYKAANAEEAGVLFKNDAEVAKVTEAKVVATSQLKYLPAQLSAMGTLAEIKADTENADEQ